MSDLLKNTGELIRERRLERGLSQKELGSKLGVLPSTVNRYELGEQNFTLETIQKIANALRIKCTVLLE